MSNRRGFSLVELMIVCALIAFTVLLVRIPLGFFGRMRTAQAVDLLYHTIGSMRHAALATAQEQQITCTNQSYTARGSTITLPEGLTFGFLPQVLGPPSAPSHLITQPITFKNSTIACFPDGTIASGTVYMLDNRTNSMYAITSGVAAVPFLRKYRFDNNWHLIE